MSRKAGVEFVIENVQKFRADAQIVTDSINKVTRSMGAAGGAGGVGGGGVGAAVGGFGEDFFTSIGRGAVSLLGKLNPLTIATNLLGDAFSYAGRLARSTLAVALGITLWRAVDLVGKGIMELARNALDATAAFQTLTIQAEGLYARELRSRDATLSMADALVQAKGPAKELLDWERQLAITSPYTMQDITRTTTLAMAYQFTAKQAQALTLAINDFAGGMGLTNEEMSRIIVNFGQMKAAGKVMGTELRDLARGSYMPVLEIVQRLADRHKVSFASMKADLSSGAVNVNEFFQEFIRMADEDFKGAAVRMSHTWKGVLSNVQDFIQTVVGVEALGPLMQRFADMGYNALQKLLGPDVQAQFTNFGVFLNATFGQMAEDALTWGNNLMAQFANGIMKAAVDVLNAITHIANLIAAAFQPGSPPKILPEFDVWGTQTMNEWLKGMTKADFSTLDTIGGEIGSYFRSLMVGESKIPMIDRIIGSYGALSAGMNDLLKFGQITRSTMNSVQASLAGTTDELRNYVNGMFALGEATQYANKVQREYNELEAYWDAILAPLQERLNKATDRREDVADRKRLGDLNELLGLRDLTAEERERLEAERDYVKASMDVRAVETKKRAALAEKQAEVDRAIAIRDALQNQVDIMKQLVDWQIQLNNLQKERLDAIEAEERAKKLKKGAKAPVGPTSDINWDEFTMGLGGAGRGEPKWGYRPGKGPFDALIKAAGEAGTALKNLATSFIGIFDPFKADIDSLKQKFQDLQIAIDQKSPAIDVSLAMVGTSFKRNLQWIAREALHALGLDLDTSKLAVQAWGDLFILTMANAGVIAMDMLAVKIVGAIQLSSILLAIGLGNYTGAIAEILRISATGIASTLADVSTAYWKMELQFTVWLVKFIIHVNTFVDGIKTAVEGVKTWLDEFAGQFYWSGRRFVEWMLAGFLSKTQDFWQAAVDAAWSIVNIMNWIFTTKIMWPSNIQPNVISGPEPNIITAPTNTVTGGPTTTTVNNLSYPLTVNSNRILESLVTEYAVIQSLAS